MSRIQIIILALFSYSFVNTKGMDSTKLNSSFHVYTGAVSGNLINWFEPEEIVTSGLELTGFKLIDKHLYEGSISHSFAQHDKTYLPVNNLSSYPYLIMDDSLKTMTINTTNISGSYFYNMSNKTSIGFSSDYKISTSYNKKDPSYNNASYDFSSVLLLKTNINNYSLEISPHFSRKVTEIKFSKLGNNDLLIYQLIGLGFMQNPEYYDYYNNKISSKAYGLNSLLSYSKNPMTFIVEADFTREYLNTFSSNRQWSIKIPEGFLKSLSYKLAPAFTLTKVTSEHKLMLQITALQQTGKEAIRRRVLDEQTYIEKWEYLGRVDKYRSKKYSCFVNYSFTNYFNNHTFTISPSFKQSNHKELYDGIEKQFFYTRNLSEYSLKSGWKYKTNEKLFGIQAAYTLVNPLNTEADLKESVAKRIIYDSELLYYADDLHRIRIKMLYGKQLFLSNNIFFGKIALTMSLITSKHTDSGRYAANLSFILDF